MTDTIRTFDDVDMRRIQRAVSWVEKQTDKPAGEIPAEFGYADAVALASVPVYNAEATAAPAGGLALLGEWNATVGAFEVTQPTDGGDAPLVMLATAIAVAGVGRAWLDFKPHTLAVADNSAMTAGDRLGVDTGVSWNAVADDFGPFQIVSIPTDSTTYVIAVRLAASAADPYLYKVTGTGSGTVDVKKVDNSGTATGSAITVIDGSAWS